MTPFKRATLPELSEEKIRALAELSHSTPRMVKEEIKKQKSRTIGTWMNDVYQVSMIAVPSLPGWPKMVWLSIKRRDKQPIHDWRDLQKIKNELVGPENEGVELYPAESRLADSANQYHLWVNVDPGVRWPFGFKDRLVSGESGAGCTQRPFDEGGADGNL